MALSQNISRVAELLHLPASTLRYWDRCGLLRFERDPSNGYRRFSGQTVIDICDVALYRDMAIPVREIRHLPSASPEQLHRVLENSEAHLLAQLDLLQQRLQRVRAKKEMIARLKQLESDHGIVTEALPEMLAEDFTTEQTIQTYLADSYSSTVFLSAEEPGLLRCGILCPGGTGPILRPADRTPRRYWKGLLRVVAASPQENSAPLLRQAARELGCRTGDIVGRYLITACQEQRYDYYEAWVELPD